MGEGVQTDLRPRRRDGPDDVRVAGRAGADHEERGGDVVLGQDREDLRRPLRVRSVVERECDRLRGRYPGRRAAARRIDHRPTVLDDGGHRVVPPVRGGPGGVNADLGGREAVRDQDREEHPHERRDDEPARAHRRRTAPAARGPLTSAHAAPRSSAGRAARRRRRRRWGPEWCRRRPRRGGPRPSGRRNPRRRGQWSRGRAGRRRLGHDRSHRARAVGRGVARVVGRALSTPGGAVAAGNPGTTPLPSTGMAGRGPVTLDEFATRRTTPT